MGHEKPIRDTREVEHLASVGGSIEFRWLGVPTKFPQSEILFVQRWEIDRKFTNARLAMSGGLGSIQRRRVADDFIFRAIVAVDLTTIRRSIGIGPYHQPFLGGRLEGSTNANYMIAMNFRLGDPTFVTDPDYQTIHRPVGLALPNGVYYSCKEVTLERVVCITDIKGKKVVGYLVTGAGSAPLRRNVGPIWTGSGAFGFAVDKGERKGG